MSGITRAVFAEQKREAHVANVNEQLTRQRVERLERWAVVVGGIVTRGFWGRAKWLFLGR
jgi:hypothetical protein